MNESITCRKRCIRKSVFDNVDMSETRFENINLSGAEFHDVNFSNVDLSHAQLGGTVFRNIGLPPDAPKGARQRPVRFEDAVLCGSVFRNVDLSDVQMNDCDISGMKVDGYLVSELIKFWLERKA